MKKIMPYLFTTILVCLFFLTQIFLYFYQNYGGEYITLSDDNGITQHDVFTSEGKINLNIATKDELLVLPEIGETLAGRIVNYRDKNGPFKDINELSNIRGISVTIIDKIKPYVSLGE